MGVRFQTWVVVVLGLVASFPSPANTINWKNGASGNWSDSANWNPKHVPGAGDTAVITANGNYTVTLDIAADVGGLTLGANDGNTQTLAMNGQTLTLAGRASINPGGHIDLSSGTISGDASVGGASISGSLICGGGALAGSITLTTNSVLTLAGPSNPFSGLTVFTNLGTVAWGEVVLSGPSNLQIYNYGLWYTPSVSVFARNGGTFNNFGTFRRFGATSRTTMGNVMVLKSSGTVDVESGTLALETGLGGGVFTNLGVISFGSNSVAIFTISNSAAFSGTGLVEGGVFGNNAALSGTITASALNLIGTMSLATNSVLNLTGTIASNTISGTFTNYGTVTWSNTDLYGGIQIVNYGLWDAKTDNTFHGGGTTFNNYGTFRKSGGVLYALNSTYFDSSVTFNNFATLDLQSGMIRISSGSGNGAFNIAGGTELDFSPAYTLTGSPTFSGAGNVAGSLNGNNALIQGTLSFYAGSWTSCNLSGTMSIATNGTLNLVEGGAAPTTFNGILFTNWGTVNWFNTSLNGSFNPQVYNYGVWNTATNNTFYGGSGGGATTFNNFGIVRKIGGVYTGTIYSLFDNSTLFNNFGTLDVQSGLLRVEAGFGNGIFNISNNAALFLYPGYTLSGDLIFSGSGLVGGALTGSNATIHGALSFNSGGFASYHFSGSLTVASNAIFNLTDDSIPKTFNAVLFTNYGTVNWSNTSLNGASSPQIYNYGLWNTPTNATMSGVLFNNYGTFRKSGGVFVSPGQNFTYLDSSTTFNNFGAVDAEFGGIILSSGTSSAGSFNIVTNTFINLGLLLSGDLTFTGAGRIAGDMTGSNAVIHGVVNVINITLGGTLTLASNCVLCLSAYPPQSPGGFQQPIFFDGTIFTNYGTVIWTNSDFNGDSSPQIYNYGLWDAAGNNTFYGGNGGGMTTFNNYGTFRKSSGKLSDTPNETSLDANTSFNNHGTADVQTGMIQLGGNYSLVGGTLNFSVNNSNDFGSLSLAGNAGLAGALSVSFNNGYSPVVSNSFPLVTYGSETGTFASLNLPALPKTLSWQTDYGATTFTLSVASAPLQVWTQSSAPIANWQSIASSADGTKMAAVAFSGGIYISTNSGATWTKTSAPTANWLSTASSADGARLVAVVYNGGIYTSTNSGTTWTQTTAPIANWYCVASSADGIKLAAVAEPGGVYTSTNFGVTWTQTSAPNAQWSSVASSADGTKLAAVAISGGIYTSTNSGTAWTQTSAPSNAWETVASSADGTKLAAGAEPGEIYTSTNSGTTWTPTSAPKTNWYSITSSADGAKLAAAISSTVGGIYTSTNFGTMWTQTTAPGAGWTSIASSADGTTLAASANSGGIWIYQSMPMPQMNIMPTNGILALWWIVPSSDFVLQRSGDLSGWSDMINTPVLNLTNLQNQVFLPSPASNVFYRLKTP